MSLIRRLAVENLRLLVGGTQLASRFDKWTESTPEARIYLAGRRNRLGKISMDGMTQNIKAFDADHGWVEANKGDLLASYADQWIAVKNGNVVASAATLDELLSQVPNPNFTCIAFMSNEPMEMLL